MCCMRVEVGVNEMQVNEATRFQQAFNNFYPFNDVERPVQTPQTFGSTKSCTHVEGNV